MHLFETVIVWGQPMLFTRAHLDHITHPRGIRLYAVKHRCDNPEQPIQLCSRTIVNRLGFLLTNFPIPMRNHPRLESIFRDNDAKKDWIPSVCTVNLQD